MDGVWNLWDVKPPPACSLKTVLHFKEMTGLNEVIFQAFKTLKDLNHLDKEGAILSRFLYKNHRIFRHDKGMQNLLKINQCLKRYLKLDMSGILHTFKQSLPFKFSAGATHAYLPTQPMLKWVLLKLQAFSQIFVRLINLTKEVGVYFLSKSWLGWSIQLSLIIFSICARILSTSKYLVKKSIEWYNSLYKYLPLLQNPSDFLPGYSFPTNLSTWLGPVDLSPLKKKTLIDKIFDVIDLAKSDDEEEKDEDSEVKILHEKFMKSLFKVKVTTIDSDVEEIVEEENKSEKKGVKRTLEISQYEDVGVPVNVEEEGERSRKKLKKNRGGKRLKWLKKVKKNLNDYDESGGNKTAVGGFKKKRDDYITID